MRAIRIERVAAGNLALLDRTADDVFDGPIQPAQLAACVAEPNQLLYVAVADGLVVGQCLGVIHRHPDRDTELYIDDLGVAPGWQRQGLATRLVHQLIADARAAGCREIWVGADPDNVAANALYHSLGLSSRLAVIFEGSL